MKFSLEWLKHFLDTDASVAEIAAALNRIGHEVEGIEDPADKLAGFRVAKVLTAEKHPDADKLQVLSVDTGEGDPLQVVCGAPNARSGMKGVLGLPGAVVPANGMELRKSAIRGVESNGMMCSVRELELGDEHDGIIELPEDAPVGTSFADYSDASPVFDVAITPNRPDCMGVMGIARDLAAAGLGTFKPVEVPTIAGEGACPVEIRTDDPEGCPAFYGRVIRGVDNTNPSPEWIQRRLKAAIRTRFSPTHRGAKGHVMPKDIQIQTDIFTRRESEARSYCRSIPAVFTSASGSILKDAEGAEYIDFLAGCSTLNYGHNDDDMKKALIEHI